MRRRAVAAVAACLFAGPFGDLDQDRDVDAVDLAIISGYVERRIEHGEAPFTAPKIFADLNLDHAIDSDDVELMREHLAGNIESLPVVPGPAAGEEEHDGTTNRP